jgi:hypothetical protein
MDGQFVVGCYCVEIKVQVGQVGRWMQSRYDGNRAGRNANRSRIAKHENARIQDKVRNA